MALIVLTDDELDALQGEPADVFKFYVCLRRRMDKRTGLVGAAVGVSWQGLREDMYIEPTPGRQGAGLPSEKYVRHKATCLEALGLLENQTSYQRLVFLLPKSHRVEVRQKNKGQIWGRVTGQALGQTETHAQQGEAPVMGQALGQTENALMGHTSEFRVNPLSVVNENAAPCLEAVDNSPEAQVRVRALSFATWIVKQERARGCISRVRETDAAVLGWANDGLGISEVQQAYSDAAWDREKHNHPGPITAAFVDSILRRRLNGRGVSKKAESGPATDARNRVWYATDDGVIAEAARLGIERTDGETVEALKLRCMVEHDRQQTARRRK